MRTGTVKQLALQILQDHPHGITQKILQQELARRTSVAVNAAASAIHYLKKCRLIIIGGRENCASCGSEYEYYKLNPNPPE